MTSKSVKDLQSTIQDLNSFYLGQEVDRATGHLLADKVVSYKSKHLVTHAVCVGMTGSGKTGLGITLLEEAARDGIPSLVIDPKGDLTNLMLTFPELRPQDFLPWIHSEEAIREDTTLEELAARRAAMWREGLAAWGMNADHIRELHDKCEVNIFTPGSDAGIPISILSSFEAPSAEVLDDVDLFRDRISTTATSLLTLLGIDADPIRSREHILLTTIFEHCWRRGQNLALGSLIQQVQSPPVSKVGVMDLNSFFPSKDRFELAMAMNNLLASPGFASWLTGETMDVDRLLHSSTGKPRISICYTAHLSESERMFFTSLLLNQTLSWMRSRSGTSSLRAVLYIDEIFGYMPPVSEPPTKKPLLTLLKQARAYGLGLVLSTQNPVDLDYKGLSNTGTWFLGRLQTERDKERMLDGLEGVSNQSGSGFKRQEISDMISALGKRVFLLHNVHDPKPCTFMTRWALSYLAGPLTRNQIKDVMRDKKSKLAAEISNTDANSPPASGGSHPSSPAAEASATPLPVSRPVLPPDVPQVFLPIQRPYQGEVTYHPQLLAIGQVHYVDTRRGLSADEPLAKLADTDFGPLGVPWDKAQHLDLDPRELLDSPPMAGRFLEPPSELAKSKNYRAWKRSLEEHVYRSFRHGLLRCPQSKEVSKSGETERDFRVRIAESARERRDEAVESLREKYDKKLAVLEERLRKAELRLQREEQEASGAMTQTMINVGATILGAVLGRKRISSTTVGRAATTVRGAERASKQVNDVRRVEADIESYEDKMRLLEEECRLDVAELEQKYDPLNIELDKLELKPRKTDIDIRHLALAWLPVGRDAAGREVVLFNLEVAGSPIGPANAD